MRFNGSFILCQLSPQMTNHLYLSGFSLVLLKNPRKYMCNFEFMHFAMTTFDGSRLWRFLHQENSLQYKTQNIFRNMILFMCKPQQNLFAKNGNVSSPAPQKMHSKVKIDDFVSNHCLATILPCVPTCFGL